MNALRRAWETLQISVNGRRAKKGWRLKIGDVIRWSAPERPNAPAASKLAIAWQSDELLLINKPPGVSCVQLAGSRSPSVAAQLRAGWPETAEIGRPGEAGLVHRLDRDTSGLLLAARNARAYRHWREAFTGHLVIKGYAAAALGELPGPAVLEHEIVHRLKSTKKYQALPVGQDRRGKLLAVTAITPLASHGGISLVRCLTNTGRPHQIRAQFAAIGHALAGDALYGGPGWSAQLLPGGHPGHHLHAFYLALVDQQGRLVQEWRVALPAWAKNLGAPTRLPVTPKELLGWSRKRG